MRIALVHNQYVSAPPKGDWRARSKGNREGELADLGDVPESQMLDEIELIRTSLVALGHEASTLMARDAAELSQFLIKRRPELIFNCCEALAGNAALEMNVAALFELFGVPYTGSSALTLGMLLNKPLTKALLGARGIRTPAYFVVEPGYNAPAAHGLSFPLIVKPVAEDASLGIDDGAVVKDQAGLAERVRFVCREFGQPALVEEFIDGREFNVALLATSPTKFATLAIGEVAFDMLPAGRPRILGYDAKWNPTATFTHVMAARCPASLDEFTADRIRRVSLDVAKVVGLRDYGRVDLRLRESDQALFVLEVNPNPDLSQDCAFMRAARASGRNYRRTIGQIVQRAVERCGLEREPQLALQG